MTEPGGGIQSLLIDDPESLTADLLGWDSLAQRAGRPFCAPAWMLACWRHGCSGDVRLRIVLVRDDGGELIGVGPFFAQVTSIGPLALAEYRVLGAGLSHRVGPLAAPGREVEVAIAIARVLAEAQPSPASVVLEGIDAGDHWAELLRDNWPGARATVRTDLTMDAPCVDLRGGYEVWLQRRERKFRKESRRAARRLQELEVSARITDEEDAVDALLHLHAARWEDRGGSGLGPGAREVVLDARRALHDSPGRLQVALLTGPEGPIAAELILCAGATMTFWTGGFDPDWAAYAPGTQTMLAALAAAGTEVEVGDLGGGAHAYKQRMADGSAPIAWRTVFPLGTRYPIIRLLLLPKHTRMAARALFRRLPAALQTRLRAGVHP